MTEVKVKTELPDDYIQEVIWQGEAKEEKKAVSKDGTAGDVPAEICVVIGGVRNQQTLGEHLSTGSGRGQYSGTWIFDQALTHASGSYECGICGKKYKYYNCFQTHVRAHRAWWAAVYGVAQNNFRYTCDICGKKYKYYSCFQEHRDLHAVDVFSVEGAPENRADPFDQGVVATDEVKEEPPEPFQKIGPKTGNYTCEFCGKQYKYYTPYQEHVALHAPISTAPGWEPPDDPDTGSECSHPEVSPSPRFVAAKTQTNQSGKKAPASVVRCSTLLHRTPPATQTQTFRTPNSGSPASKATAGTNGLCFLHVPSAPCSSSPACHSCACGHCSLARARVEGPWLSGTDLGPCSASCWLCDSNDEWRTPTISYQSSGKTAETHCVLRTS
uniref:C2H2-type domain-containing protein n=1 Tax=Capra hircus TaxID=9925 RepID=A0A8C2NS67_CAPHI